MLSYYYKFSTVQYSGLATQVCRGRGKVPVADYKVAKYVSGENGDEPLQATRRSCYSFCMCPGGQVLLSVFEFLDDPISVLALNAPNDPKFNMFITSQ